MGHATDGAGARHFLCDDDGTELQLAPEGDGTHTLSLSDPEGEALGIVLDRDDLLALRAMIDRALG